MSNLLDKASVILTPTAYKNSRVMCVKPSDASGDFTFSRNSAATRVNAQGLVENVQILSSNLVQNGDFSEEGSEEVSNGSFSQEGSQLITNGDFSNGSTDWNLIGTATITENQANIVTASAVTGISQSNILTVGKSYKLSYNIVSNNNGGLKISGNEIPSVVGNNTYYFEASAASLEILRNSGVTDISITNLSVREVGQDWDLSSSNISIGEDKLVCNNVLENNAIATQVNVIPVQKQVKVQFHIVVNSGSFRMLVGSGGTSTIVTTSGTYTFYETSGTGGNLNLQARAGGFDGSITNISVKEVGMNWSLESATIELGKLTLNSAGGAMTYAYQSGLNLVANTSYLISLNATRISGDTNLALGSTGVNNVSGSPIITTSGVQSYNFTPTSNVNNLGLKRDAGGSGAVWEITSFSVIEITDDTNLPRISYENFSYQDALGSELVTNGSFDTDSANWFLTGTSFWVNSSIEVPTGGLSQAFTLANNKTYKITFDVIQGSGIDGGVYVNTSYNTPDFANNVGITTTGVGGTYTFTFTMNGGSNGITLTRRVNNQDIRIDNVSVKEYLGQEVVPNSGCGSWLFESQSTNLITQSELFSDASWNKSRSTYTSDAIKSPSGLINMGYLTEDTTSSNTHYMRTFLTLTDGVDYTLSVFAKAKERNIICLGDNAAAQSNTGVWFDLTNGVVLSQRSGYVGSIKDFGNGIYRCSVIYSASASRQYADIALSLSDGVNIYTGDGTSGVYIWGAMLEQGNISSYIPTSGSTVTRNQDLCTNGGSLATINSTSGVLYAEIAALANDGTTRRISLKGSIDNANRLNISFNPATNTLQCFGFVGNVLQFNFTPTLTDTTQFNKIALKYKENDFALWVNGVEVATDTSGITWSANTLNELLFGNTGTTELFFGKTKALAVFPYLTDQELTELTTI